jgi:hypothetical protein
MADPALLALVKVRINRRAGNVYVYEDRIVVATDAGERTIPMDDLERLATRRTWRGARILLALTDGEIVEIRGLSASHARGAHRTIVGLARAR